MIITEMARTVTLCRNNKKKPHIKPGRVLYGASIAGATLEQLHSSILSGRKERKMFDLREKACKEINEKFGLNITVKKREVEQDGEVYNNSRGDNRE